MNNQECSQCHRGQTADEYDNAYYSLNVHLFSLPMSLSSLSSIRLSLVCRSAMRICKTTISVCMCMACSWRCFKSETSFCTISNLANVTPAMKISPATFQPHFTFSHQDFVSISLIGSYGFSHSLILWG